MTDSARRSSTRPQHVFRLFTSIVVASIALTPQGSLACACGCGIFDVGVGTMGAGSLAANGMGSGASVYFRYDYMNQNQNWEGGSKAPDADNGDKQIVTSFYTVGGDYIIDPDWTVMAELPIFDRRLTTTDDGTVAGPPGSVYTGQLTAQGDLQVMGYYTGIESDQSTGLMLGIKFPTGDFTGPNGPLGGAEFDRDSLPGTGSTDVMIGAYKSGNLNVAQTIGYFLQARYQVAFASQDGYRPGNEVDAAGGLTYDIGAVDPVTDVVPLLQMLVSHRDQDSGPNADPLNSGYTRLLISPGVEVRYNHVRLYGDIEWPIYQYTNAASSVAIEGTSGQLVASPLYKLQLTYDF
jgi:hypothetical protein